MLYTQSVNTRLLEILSELMNNSYFDNFFLVGGTSIALQIGHRLSVDIDLFGSQELDEIEISNFLLSLGKVQILKKSKNILIYSVDGIKVDFVNYQYPWLYPPTIQKELRLAHLNDLAAMKLNAISGRGSKKDFIDIYFLLQYISLAEMISLYQKKFKDGSSFLVLKSLTFFDDADSEQTPKMLIHTSWKNIKETIISEVKKYFETK